MAHPARPADTTPEAQAMLIARWRSMTVAERAALVRKMCDDVERLARADIVAGRPGLTEREINQELARRRYGPIVANAMADDRSRPR
jgi:hypothetical protein